MYEFSSQEEMAHYLIKLAYDLGESPNIDRLCQKVAAGRLAERMLELLNHKPEEVVCEE